MSSEHDTTRQLLELYEHALAIGSSLDARQTARNFLTSFVKRQQLPGGAIWWREPKTADGQPERLILLDAFPRNMAPAEHLDLPHALWTRAQAGRDSLAVLPADEAWPDRRPTSEYPWLAILTLGRHGLLTLAMNQENQVTETQVRRWQALRDKLAVALEGARAHEALAASERTMTESNQQLQKARDTLELYAGELAHTERRLRRIMDNLPSMLWVKHRDGRYILANNVFQSLLGITEAALFNRRDSELFPIELARVLGHGEREALKTGEATHETLSVSLPGQETARMLEMTWVPLVGSNGEIGSLLGVANDVTEHLQLARSLRESERRLSQLARTVDVAFWLRTPDRILYVNPAYATIWGETTRSLIRQPDQFLAAVLPDDRERVADAVTRLRRNRENFDETFRIRRPDGQIRWVHARAQPVGETQGELLTAGTASDITREKQTEQRLRAQTEQLQTLFDVIPVGITLVNERSEIIDCNAAAEKILGLSKAEHTQRRIIEADWTLMRPDGSPMPAEEIPAIRAMQTGRPVQDVEMLLDTPRGRVFLSVNATPVENQHFRVLVSYVDITSRRRDEQRLRMAASVFSHAREGILITLPDSTIVDANQAFEQITGYSRDEVIGRTPALLQSGYQGDEFYAGMWRQLVEDGYWHGEIRNRKKDGEVYLESLTISAVNDERGEVQHYVALFSDITLQRHLQEERIHNAAHYDPLTGLANRSLLDDRLHQAIVQARRNGQELMVAHLDIDKFSRLNEIHGHDAGDAILLEVARRVQSVMRETDTLARLGGDDLILVLGGLGSLLDGQQVVDRALNEIEKPVEIGELSLQVTASVGIATYPQDQDASDADQLLRQADQAMYEAKLDPTKRYHVFDVAHDQVVRSHQELLARLGQALENNELRLHYQPKVNMRSGEIIGVESLIRWQHPDRGLLGPAAFIPSIENHPLDEAIGDWVIRRGLEQLLIWHETGLDLSLSVNVSTRQLQSPDFALRLGRILEEYPQWCRSRLEIEVLESGVMLDIQNAAEVMKRCDALGVRFALDDFGTGYSSLTYLKRLPAKIVKIDQSFVRHVEDDPSDVAILETIVHLSEAFSRTLIAEGVEEALHGQILLMLGCECAQGYGIARPMDAARFPEWARSWSVPAVWRDVPCLSRDRAPLLRGWIALRRWQRQTAHALAEGGKRPTVAGLARALTDLQAHLVFLEDRAPLDAIISRIGALLDQPQDGGAGTLALQQSISEQVGALCDALFQRLLRAG
ncbi:MAG: EAL domain-containing protein [Halothiobacillaceae bacterium]